ncbi:Sfi1 spindle body protein-domain-containing protein [Protomyces lactucae-debilis]|uniref:Sfi1 spindle body protein-domain-containing protein n=1 Tax=Protomyces lactucae-debilis TaxID=2754530 RepID=A0A1Y2FAR9_PROLT|nr:Sfi1 spindle body protein-domain-containing protein [Protomyces lactucae-debilis]ORY81009.1 Sfi1 spindle body protein-domain-containing protein [Protomyces lactucae-debilis]
MPHHQKHTTLFSHQEHALLQQVVRQCLRKHTDNPGSLPSQPPQLGEALAALQVVQQELHIQEESDLGRHLWTLVCKLARLPGESWPEKLSFAAQAGAVGDPHDDADDEDEDEGNEAGIIAGYRSESASQQPELRRAKYGQRQSQHRSGYATASEVGPSSVIPSRRMNARAGNKSVLSQRLAFEEAEEAKRRDLQRIQKRRQPSATRAPSQVRSLSPPRMAQPQPFKEPQVTTAKQAELTRIYLDVESYRLGRLLEAVLDHWRSRFREHAYKKQEIRRLQHKQYEQAVRIDHTSVVQLAFNLWYDRTVRSLETSRIQGRRADYAFLDKHLYRWSLKVQQVKRQRWLDQIAAAQENQQAAFAAQRDARCLHDFALRWRTKLARHQIASKQAVRVYQRTTRKRSLKIWFCSACEQSLIAVHKDSLARQCLQAWRVKKQVREISLARVDASRDDMLLARFFECWAGKMIAHDEDGQVADEMVASRFLSHWRRSLALHEMAKPIVRRTNERLATQALIRWQSARAERKAVAKVGQFAKLSFIYQAWRRETICTRFTRDANFALAQRFFAAWQREAVLRQLQAEQDVDLASRALFAWTDKLRDASGASGSLAQAEFLLRQRQATRLRRTALDSWLIRLADHRSLETVADAEYNARTATWATEQLSMRFSKISAMRAEAKALDSVRLGSTFLKRWQISTRRKKEQDENTLVARYQHARESNYLIRGLQHWRTKAQVALTLRAQGEVFVRQSKLKAKQDVMTLWHQTATRRGAQFSEAGELDADGLLGRLVAALERKVSHYRENCADADALFQERENILYERMWTRWQDRYSVLVENQKKADARAERLRKAHERGTRHRLQRVLVNWLGKMRHQRGMLVANESGARLHSSGSWSGSAHSSILERRERSRAMEDGKWRS